MDQIDKTDGGSDWLKDCDEARAILRGAIEELRILARALTLVGQHDLAKKLRGQGWAIAVAEETLETGVSAAVHQMYQASRETTANLLTLGIKLVAQAREDLA